MPSEEQTQLNPKQLRNRRSRILHDQAKEYREEKRVRAVAGESTKQSSAYLVRLYIVIGTAIIVTICAGLNYSRPSFISKPRKKQPSYHLATMYPPNVVVERDLPRFFRTYTIATPQNKEARRAAKRIAASRLAARKGNGNIRVILKAWDSSNIEQLLRRQICGADFSQAYDSTSSQERKEDMVMWCLLAIKNVEGFFLESVDILESALIAARRRGMVVRSSSSDSKLLNAYYLHPRNLEYESTKAILPSKVLAWILSNPEDVVPSIAEYRRMLQEYLHELVHSEGNDDKYMVLDEVCQPYPPKRAIFKQCGVDVFRPDACCYFVIPESEGGRFGDSSSGDDEEEKVIRPQTLRAGVQDGNEASS
jgi:hypothetical protein